MKTINIVLAYVVCLKLNLIASDVCWRINSRQLPYYKLMKSHCRSNELIVSRTIVQNVNECTKFARAKKALAFNYGLETDLYERNIGTRNRSKARNVCQALECPETYNFTTLVHDENYKYYSTYPTFIPTGSNYTLACIPKLGVFVFSSNNLNFSQAQSACQKMNASIAHIISDERTNGLGKYISLNTPTFVGLSNRNDERLWKNEFEEPLSCFNYRAWGKGQPSNSKGCVSLVQPPTSTPRTFWKVEPCDSTLPFICELSPMYRRLSNRRI